MDHQAGGHAGGQLSVLSPVLSGRVGGRAVGDGHERKASRQSLRPSMGTVAFSRAAVNVLPQWRCSPAAAFNSPPTGLSAQAQHDDERDLHEAFRGGCADRAGCTSRRSGADRDAVRYRRDPLVSDNAASGREHNSIVHAVQDLECLKRGLFESPGSLYDAETYTAGIEENQSSHP